MTWWEGKQ